MHFLQAWIVVRADLLFRFGHATFDNYIEYNQHLEFQIPFSILLFHDLNFSLLC